MTAVASTPAPAGPVRTLPADGPAGAVSEALGPLAADQAHELARSIGILLDALPPPVAPRARWRTRELRALADRLAR